ncbi:[Acyl-carrier-protein] S-malonyltransferase [Candidatus Thermokryptus mobilis]|uniref:Malonyl CoA-acyl carrier protein transacylase n=1 Tax=Candidatus Thermokryptus mobilis TaxID=1643428 RepID=A0A0S4N1N6_9BACT|nr:ACP S-malonyltransferase [Candidatus Thermokryptus mobilis]CUU04095.1 [Acyl-carrier-protein] S-malonyltransferase [Candidatus Thermokryptus mobilis]
MKIAFVFPGQASQYVGMGKDLYEGNSLVKEIYDRAEEILGFELKKICFEGPEELLKQTRITQPAIFVHSYVVSKLLEGKLKADMAAGHSLGEYSALVYADALDFETALMIVKVRGELMQKAGEQNPGTMAAIVGLDDEKVKKICEEVKDGIVQPANFNAIGQVVISGEVGAVKMAMEIAKREGAKMVKELVVSGAFHSPLMESAKDELKKILDEVKFRKPKIPVYFNVTAKPTFEAEEIKDLLYLQITKPVLWTQTILNMRSDGAVKFYEIGPGKVLQGLIKRTLEDVEVAGFDKLSDIQNLKDGLV